MELKVTFNSRYILMWTIFVCNIIKRKLCCFQALNTILENDIVAFLSFVEVYFGMLRVLHPFIIIPFACNLF